MGKRKTGGIPNEFAPKQCGPTEVDEQLVADSTAKSKYTATNRSWRLQRSLFDLGARVAKTERSPNRVGER